jgi:prepilin-type N-terminal cleavage/methylation domain-containing protein
MNKKRGFTLIELLIIIVILAILAALFYVNYRGAIKQQRLHKVFALLQVIAEGKREQMVRSPLAKVRGRMYNSHNTSGTCQNYTVETTVAPDYLIACEYLPKEQWESADDDFRLFLCHDGGGGWACTQGFTPGDAIAAAMLDTDDGWWYYFLNAAGECTSAGTNAVPCPEF